ADEIGCSPDSIVLADSGNGAHTLVRIDEPADRDTIALIKRCLEALDFRWSTQSVEIDTSVGNPARIWRLYGTVAAKREALPHRPHRRSRIIQVPERIIPAPRPILERLAAIAPEIPDLTGAGRPGRIDLAHWLADVGIGVAASKSWQGGILYRLAACPMAA